MSHTAYRKGETVAAIATPPGDGGVAIVRISGDDALPIAGRLFSKPVEEIPSHTLRYGHIVDEQGAVIDEVLLCVMRAPRTFTGEETVEIHCHGGSLITKKVLATALKAGARAALPGEFTFKAYMNGKIDLAQAEAIQELIGAKNDTALNLAQGQLEGALSREIRSFQKELVDTAAILEAWVDFPEEGIEYATNDELLATLEATVQKMRHLQTTFADGKRLTTGISLAIIGAPNVGKSSLMNLLLRKERAIVTPIPGTTRDLLEEDLTLGSLHFRLIDTAGLRTSNDTIEQEGIRRTRATIESSDLILHLLDATNPAPTRDLPDDKTLTLYNKTDLPHPPLPANALAISAKTGTGLDTLKQTIEAKVWENGPPDKEEVVLCSLRHEQALSQAITSLEAVSRGLQDNLSPEFLTADMRAALSELGTIIGTNITEEILSSIFSKFCIGK